MYTQLCLTLSDCCKVPIIICQFNLYVKLALPLYVKLNTHNLCDAHKGSDYHDLF